MPAANDRGKLRCSEMRNHVVIAGTAAAVVLLAASWMTGCASTLDSPHFLAGFYAASNPIAASAYEQARLSRDC